MRWLAVGRRYGPCIQRIAMQCKVHCFCNNGTGKDCLKLGSGLEPLH